MTTKTTTTKLAQSEAAAKPAPHAYRRPNAFPVTRADILAKIAVKAGITLPQAEAAYDTLLKIAYAGAKQASGIILPGLVRLSIGKRAARVARNPITGAPVRIPAAKVIKVIPLKALRDSVHSKQKL